MGIANHINPDNDGAWPSQDRLAGYANCSDRYVRDAIGELVKLGELRFESRSGNSKTGNRPNRYWLTLSCPQDCDGTVNHRTRKPQELSAQTTGTLSQNHRNPTSDEPVIEPVKEPLRKATKISDDFAVTLDKRKWALDNIITIDIELETKKFIAYYQANDKPMKNWDAAWRNWILKAQDFQRPLWEKMKDKKEFDSRTATDSAKKATKEFLIESQKAAETAAPPPKCEHDKSIVSCMPCLRKLS
jgi:hypothetical protein